ncbi:MAG: LPS export ABC transporter periplasmic protein LptC [Elusimicrobiaceae bacterium]|nr:LPS export ABC transporter periplasmic protein LptC [Elusimicrobiaceae bacterium]
MKKIVLLWIAVWGLSACSQKESFTPDENAGEQIATHVSIFESKASQKQWLLTAEAVDFADLKTATLKNPVLLLKQNGADSARITGQNGIFDYAAKQISIQGNATIDSFTEQTKITTDRFFYDINKDRVWSDVKTTVTRGGAKAVARGGIETDSKLTKIELKKHTTRIPTDIRDLKQPQ